MTLQPLPELPQEPCHEELVRFLRSWSSTPALLRLTTQEALVTRRLIVEILPHFIRLLKDDLILKELFVVSLASLAGINALLAQGKADYVEVLLLVLISDEFSLLRVIQLLKPTLDDIKSQQLWQQYLSLIPGGKVYNRIASLSLGRGVLENIRSFADYLSKQFYEALTENGADSATFLSQFLDRSSTIGNSGSVTSIFDHLAVEESQLRAFSTILASCNISTTSRILSDVLQLVETRYLHAEIVKTRTYQQETYADRVGAIGTLLSTLCQQASVLNVLLIIIKKHYAKYNISVRRGILLAIQTTDRASLLDVAKYYLALSTETLYIKHTPIVVQDALTETFLLACSYLDINELTRMSKSQTYVKCISRHLEATTEQVRFLGMVIGESISAKVISDPAKRLKFDLEDPPSSWWLSLINVHDVLQPLSSLNAGIVSDYEATVPKPPSTSVGPTVLELSDDVSSSDDDFVPMRMPDSDDEDSDDDPTLVDREKLPRPVYIRDLMALFAKHDSHKHIRMAIQTASSLIRRKATFGTEVSDYAIELARILIGIKDNFDLEDFQVMKQDALKALVIAAPALVCPYMAQIFFKGDYSLSERSGILSAIGLGARELAGIAPVPDEYENLKVSKSLPPSQAQSFQLDDVVQREEDKLLAPHIESAQQSLSGPNFLKINSINRPYRPRQPLEVKSLSPVFAKSIFFPLLGTLSMNNGRMLDAGVDVFYENTLLANYLRTLTLVYQVSRNTPSFNLMTNELWTVLASFFRNSDRTIIEAIAFGVLMIIESTSPMDLCLDHATILVTTQDWLERTFERALDGRARVVVATCLLRIREIVDENQGLLIRASSGFSSLARGKLGLLGL